MTPSIARLREVLSYDPDTGRLTWRVRTSWRVQIGDEAGCAGRRGYVYVRVDGCLMRANRVIFAIHTGRWPKGLVDHQDLDPSNNRWRNLREATRTQNNANSRARNKLGIKGVYPTNKGFVAKIGFNGRRIHLGTHKTPEAAHAAYVAKAKELFGEFARAG